MTDLVERLRSVVAVGNISALRDEAAAEIEWLLVLEEWIDAFKGKDGGAAESICKLATETLDLRRIAAAVEAERCRCPMPLPCPSSRVCPRCHILAAAEGAGS